MPNNFDNMAMQFRRLLLSSQQHFVAIEPPIPSSSMMITMKMVVMTSPRAICSEINQKENGLCAESRLPHVEDSRAKATCARATFCSRSKESPRPIHINYMGEGGCQQCGCGLKSHGTAAKRYDGLGVVVAARISALGAD